MRLSLLLLVVLPAIASAEDAVIIPKGAKLELLFTRSAKIKGGLT